jgi:hypothetical protein
MLIAGRSGAGRFATRTVARYAWGVIKIGLGELLIVLVVLFGMGLIFLLIRGKVRDDE